MAEKKAVGHAYNIDFLNVVFAASSIFLFVTTIWMVWDDFDREWKNTQRQFTQLELEVTRQQLAQNARGIDKAKLTGLQQQLAAAQKAMEANRERIDEVNDRLAEVDARLYPRQQGGAVRQGDLRRQPLRVRGGADKGSRRRRRAAEGDRGRGPAAERAEPRSAEDRGRAHRAAGRAREVHVAKSAGCRKRSIRSTSSRPV